VINSDEYDLEVETSIVDIMKWMQNNNLFTFVDTISTSLMVLSNDNDLCLTLID